MENRRRLAKKNGLKLPEPRGTRGQKKPANRGRYLSATEKKGISDALKQKNGRFSRCPNGVSYIDNYTRSSDFVRENRQVPH